LLLVGASGFATPEPYRFRIDVPPARQGRFGTATIEVVPGEGFHLNVARRVELQLRSSGGGVDDEGRETVRLDEAGAQLAIRFKPRAPGDKPSARSSSSRSATPTPASPRPRWWASP